MQYQIEDILREKDYKIHYMLSSLLDACADELEVLVSEELGEKDLIRRLRQRIEEIFGRHDIHPEVISLDQFVAKKIKALEPRFAHRKCRVKTRISAVPTIWIPSDVLDKIIEGLVRNAIENTPDSGANHRFGEKRGNRPRIGDQGYRGGDQRGESAVDFRKLFYGL